MKHSKNKDYILRKNLNLLNINKLKILKSLIKNEKLNKNLRFKLNFKIVNFYNSSNYKSKIKNKCILSFRPNSVLKEVRLERSFFNEFSKNSYLPGFKKSSW